MRLIGMVLIFLAWALGSGDVLADPLLSIQILRILGTPQLQVVVSKSKLWSLSCLNIAAESSFQFQIQGFRSIVSRCIFHRAWDVSALSASASCKCSASAAFQEACNRGIPSSICNHLALTSSSCFCNSGTCTCRGSSWTRRLS